MAATATPVVAHGAVHIEGIRELERAFRLYSRSLGQGLREAMEAAGQPVAFRAQELALQEITRMTIPWSRTRVGVTMRTVYIAPVERGRNTKKNLLFARRYGRPNLKTKLLDEAYIPALQGNEDKIAAEFLDALEDLGRAWSRVHSG